MVSGDSAAVFGIVVETFGISLIEGTFEDIGKSGACLLAETAGSDNPMSSYTRALGS